MLADTSSQSEFVERNIASAADLWSQNGGHSRCYQFGEFYLEARFIGGALDDEFTQTIAHAERTSADNEKPLTTVYVVVSDVLSQTPPPDHWPFPEESKEDYQRICWKPDLGLAMSSDDLRGIWHLFDLSARTGVYWVRSKSDLPSWEFGSPFRHFIHWASLHCGLTMVHGAAVGRDGKGVLLTGAGGSGKSTLTAAAIAEGWETTGDDFVLAATPPGGQCVTYPIFDVMKLGGMAESLFADFTSMALNAERSSEEKALIPISAVAGGQFAKRLEVQAILALELTHQAESQIQPLSKIDAVGALAPSTMSILRTAVKETLRDCSTLARHLPCYRLGVGKDPNECLGVLRAFMQGSV